MRTCAYMHTEDLCTQPVRSAITAAYLLRSMSKCEGIEPGVSSAMKENANYFESHAIGVLSKAHEINRSIAVIALNCQLRLWTGIVYCSILYSIVRYRGIVWRCVRLIGRACVHAMDTTYAWERFIARLTCLPAVLSDKE